jgi:hypothetical protein
MAKNVVIGMVVVFVGIAVASAGYKFGRHLAQKGTHQAPHSSSAPA